MLETIRKYWIGGLVLVMVGLHASIVGLIRYQASQAKVDVSCEVDLGFFLAYPNENNVPVSMRLHAIVPVNHRVKSRQLIELNQAQIRQAIEEHIRQIDHRVLRDPYLSDLRTQLLDVLVQTIGAASIEDLAITELQKTSLEYGLNFTNTSHPRRPKLVATLRQELKADHEEEHGHNEHGDHHDHADHGSDSHSDKARADEHHGDSNAHHPADGHKTHDSHASDPDTSHGGHGEGEAHAKPKAKAAVKYTPGMGKKKKESNTGGHGSGH